MRWKAWILALGVFAAVCLLADRVFTHYVVLRSTFSDSGRIQHLYLENDSEIPIFGSSKLHGTCIPEEMGLNAFNYGMDSASFEMTDFFLQVELAKPKTTPVIVELQYSDTGILGDQSRFIPFVSDPRVRQLLRRFHMMEWRYYLPAIRYFGYYDWLIKDYLSEHMRVTKVTDGYLELVHLAPFDRIRLDESVSRRLHSTPPGFFPNEELNRRLIAHITEHPERLFFLVNAPYHPSYFAHFQNEDELKAYEKKLAAFPNVVVLDWGRMYYPDESFFDTLHLRRVAAADFSRKLGDQIRQALRERGQPIPAGKTGSE